jgi:hypothetical protein
MCSTTFGTTHWPLRGVLVNLGKVLLAALETSTSTYGKIPDETVSVRTGVQGHRIIHFTRTPMDVWARSNTAQPADLFSRLIALLSVFWSILNLCPVKSEGLDNGNLSLLD